MACPNCNSDHRASEMTTSGVVVKCGSCGLVFGKGTPSTRAASVDDDDESPPVPAPRRNVAQPTSKATRGDASGASVPANPIPAMRKRLRWLDSEIRRLRKLERERESLARILSAASGKPVAVVRELRSSHG